MSVNILTSDLKMLSSGFLSLIIITSSGYWQESESVLVCFSLKSMFTKKDVSNDAIKIFPT